MSEEERAALIRAYWRQHGCDVDVGVRAIVQRHEYGPGKSHFSAVRSDLINGLPRDYRGGDIGRSSLRPGAIRPWRPAR